VIAFAGHSPHHTFHASFDLLGAWIGRPLDRLHLHRAAARSHAIEQAPHLGRAIAELLGFLLSGVSKRVWHRARCAAEDRRVFNPCATCALLPMQSSTPLVGRHSGKPLRVTCPTRWLASTAANRFVLRAPIFAILSVLEGSAGRA
jgi:hypothetical protein